MNSPLMYIHTKFPEDSAWNILWMLIFQCGIENVKKAIDEIEKSGNLTDLPLDNL